MPTEQIHDALRAKVALALATEVRTWPDDSSLPMDSRVGVGNTYQNLARVAVQAAAPTILAAERERIAALIDANRRGVANPDWPYNEAFIHALECAARWVREAP